MQVVDACKTGNRGRGTGDVKGVHVGGNLVDPKLLYLTSATYLSIVVYPSH